MMMDSLKGENSKARTSRTSMKTNSGKEPGKEMAKRAINIRQVSMIKQRKQHQCLGIAVIMGSGIRVMTKPHRGGQT